MYVAATSVDVHQHLWPAQLVDALRSRRHGPRLDDWTLHLPGEPVYEVDPAAHDVARRAALEAGCGRVLLSLSSPLGIEELDPDAAAPLLAAWHEGVRSLPAPFGAWASVNHVDPDLDQLKALLAEGFAGLQVPATRMATPRALERCAEVLRVCELAGRPVLVHPGPAPAPARDDGAVPAWWPAVVDYPAQLQAAWWAWQAVGRALLPDLRICFAAGAGLAPVHDERFAARAGHSPRIDPDVFVDTSSYGRRGLDSLIRVLGVDAVVLGSDRPYAEPTDPDLGTAATRAIRVANPRRLLQGGHPHD
ncbi:MAG: amidohydrolase family protein [Actinomycetes bacterium]